VDAVERLASVMATQVPVDAERFALVMAAPMSTRLSVRRRGRYPGSARSKTAVQGASECDVGHTLSHKTVFTRLAGTNRRASALPVP